MNRPSNAHLRCIGCGALYHDTPEGRDHFEAHTRQCKINPGDFRTAPVAERTM